VANGEPYALTTRIDTFTLHKPFAAYIAGRFPLSAELSMAKQNLTSMTVDALLQLRDEISTILSKKADQLKKELASLGADYAEIGRIAFMGKEESTRPKSRAKISRSQIQGNLGRPRRPTGVDAGSH